MDHHHRTSDLRRPAALVAALAALALTVFAPVLEAASLSPSRAGLLRQVRSARQHGFAYAQNDSDVRAMVDRGALVRLPGSSSYVVKWGVRYPYARPEVKLFVERLSAQYRGACGKRLVVTSLVRPKDHQPRNSSELSVHPTGMAMDLRVSEYGSCRSWLERTLVSLEGRGLVEAAREHHPPHYHVVLFPDPYLRYVAAKDGGDVAERYRSPRMASLGGSYRVQRGDSLWTIAHRFGTTTAALQRANGLRGSSIRVGQELTLPGGGGTVVAATTASGDASEGASVAPATYRVRSGDTLWSISRRFGTSTAALERLNGLRSSAIKPGQRLRVSAGAHGRAVQTAQTAEAATRYRVRSGDNLWEIARRHGTSTTSLRRANGLSSSRIKPGQVLEIPTEVR